MSTTHTPQNLGPLPLKLEDPDKFHRHEEVGVKEPFGQQDRWQLRSWRELAVLAIMGMELSWLALWFRIFTQTGLFVSFWRVFVVLGSILICVYILARLLSLLRIRQGLKRGIFGILLVTSLFYGLKTLYYVDQPLSLKDLLLSPVRAVIDRDVVIAAEFMVMLSVLWVCWRGVSFVGMGVGPASVRGSFLIGVLALSLYGMFAPLTGETPVAALYLFLFFGLLAMSAARVYVIGRLSRGLPVPFDRKWLAGMLLSVSGLVSLSLVAVFLVQWKLSNIVVTLVTWLWRLVFLVGMTLLAPVMLVLMAVVPPLAKFLQEPVLQAIQVLQDFIQEVRVLVVRLGQAVEQVFGDLSLRLGLDLVLFKQILFGVVLVVSGLIILWLLGILPRHPLRMPEEDAEALSWPGVRILRLITALQKSARSLADTAGRWINLRSTGKKLAAARIRRIYAALLELSEKLGRPRPAARTPLEYLPQLGELFPQHTTDLETITQAYLQVRYGEMPESFPEVEQVVSAWRRIQMVGQERIRALRKR